MDAQVVEKIRTLEKKVDRIMNFLNIEQNAQMSQESETLDCSLGENVASTELDLNNVIDLFRRLGKVKSFIAPDMLVIEKVCKSRQTASEAIRKLKACGRLVIQNDYVVAL